MAPKVAKQTSLSRQLEKLKVPQTSAFKETKGRVSFLYDFKDAIGIDNDTHFTIALSGLNSLCELNDSFNSYRETLFNESSKTFDRSLLSKEANDELNEEIDSYLFKVICPYFLHTSAHKTLEWLIHRYRIHQYNCDSFIGCVLPYHETKHFTRALQTCVAPKNPSDKWFWLNTIQLKGSYLPKSVLISHCTLDLGFVKIIYDSLMKSLRFGTYSYVSFYTGTLIGMIERDVSESIISLLMGFVSKGIKSKYELLIKSSYCILSYICARIKLNQKIINKLLKTFVKKYKDSCREEFYMTLSIVINSQGLDLIPNEMVNCIDIESFISFAETNEIGALTKCILKCFILQIENAIVFEKLIQLLNHLSLNAVSVEMCIETIADIIKNNKDSNLNNHLSDIVTLLERRFTSSFDDAIAKFDYDNSIKVLVKSFRYNTIIDKKLFDNLNHMSDSIREKSLKNVISNIDKFIGRNNETFIKENFINVLNNDRPDDSLLVFSLNEKLNIIFPGDELLTHCHKLLQKCIDAEEKSDFKQSLSWYQLKNSALSMYCRLTNENEAQFFSLIHHFLIPISNNDLDTLAIIIESNRFPIFKDLWQKCSTHIEIPIEERNPLMIIEILLKELSNYIINDSTFKILDAFSNFDFLSFRGIMFRFLIFHRILKNKSKDQKFKIIKQKIADNIIDLVKRLMESNKVKVRKISKDKSKEDTFIELCMKSLQKHKISWNIINNLIKTLIKSTDKCNDKSWLSFHDINKDNYVFKLLFMLFDNSVANESRSVTEFRQLLSYFVKTIGKISKLNIISSLWSYDNNNLWQIRSLMISSHFVKENRSLNKKSVISLLIALQSPLINVRIAAIKLMKSLAYYSDEFLEFCIPHNEEIINDGTVISDLISQWIKLEIASSNDVLVTVKDIRYEWINFIKQKETPIHIKCGLILLLNKCNDSEMLKQLLPIIEDALIQLKDDPNNEIIEIIAAIFTHFKNQNLPSDILSDITSLIIKSFESNGSKQLALNVLNVNFFNSMTSDAKILILKQLLKLIIEGDHVKSITKKLLNDGQVFASLLKSLSSDVPKSSKRSITELEFSLENDNWKMIIILLELTQRVKIFTNSTLWMKALFDMLKHTFIINAKSSLEYLRQLLINSIMKCLNQTDNDIGAYQIDSVIKCLRESHQKETQRLAIIAINKVSKEFRSEILHNMMAIFTFIGTNIVHCDDQYTMQLIYDTMESIVTNLLDDDTKNSMIDLFINSLIDIPTHRRLTLFQRLLNMLSESEHLWLIISKIVEHSKHKSKADKQKMFSLSLSLLLSYDIELQITSVNRMIKVMALNLKEEKQLHLKRQFKLSDNDNRIKKENIATLILNMLSSEEFVSMITQNDWENISNQFEDFLQNLMVLIELFSLMTNEKTFKEFRSYYKTLQSVLYQILQKVNSLMPNQQMIELILTLLKHRSEMIQRKALEMLNDKLTFISRNNLKLIELPTLIDPLLQLILKAEPKQHDNVIYNAQLSLISLKLLSKHFEKLENNCDLLKPVITSLIKIIEDTNKDRSITFAASCLLCLSQLIVSFEHKAIPFLPSVMPLILNLFSFKEEVIIFANVTALSKILLNYPQFMGSYLELILIKICVVKSVNYQNKSLNFKLISLFEKLSKTIPIRILVNAIDTAYNEISANSSNALEELIGLLKLGFENIDKLEIKSILKTVRKLFLKMLDFRHVNSDNGMELNVIDRIEDASIIAICTFMPKLTEASFRPLFYKIYDWAVRSKDVKLYHKRITFYRFTEVLSEKLRSLFCVFAAPSIVNHCSQMLQHFNISKESNFDCDERTRHTIISSVLVTLSKCFLYDINGSFLTKDRIQNLMNPIIDQIDNLFGNDNDYNKRIEHVCDCIKYLTQAIDDDTIVKDINYQILLKTRNNSSQIRYAALNTLHTLILATNEEYLRLMPDAIEFITELNEDDSPEIEKLFQTLCNDLEQICGEPISNFL